MCYVSYQTDRFLADEDRAAARVEWLGLKGEDDNYGRYLIDAFEQSESVLSAADNEIAVDTGELSLLSKEGQEAVLLLAVDLAIEDGFSRYDE